MSVERAEIRRLEKELARVHDLASYRRFVDEVIGHANARRHKALQIERAKLKPLPSRRTDDHEEELVIVTRSSGFFLRRIFYTVPSRLKIGRASCREREYGFVVVRCVTE